DDDLKKTATAYEKVGRDTESQRVKGMRVFLKDLKQDIQGESAIAHLTDKLAVYDHVGQEWEYGQVSLALGQVYANAKQHKEAKEVKMQKLLAFLAYALLNQGRYEDARREVEHAIDLDPLSFAEREALGDIYFEQQEYEHAIAAWQDALLCQHALLPKPYVPN